MFSFFVYVCNINLFRVVCNFNYRNVSIGDNAHNERKDKGNKTRA